MAARGLSTPLLIGGATTSALHTAVKLAPLYGHVFYAPDASASAVLAGRLMSDRAQTEADEHRKQDEIRALYEKKEDSSCHPERSEGSFPFPASTYLRGKTFADIPCRELSIGEVLPYFDWKLFYAIWGIKPDHPDDGEEVRRLRGDAEARLDDLRRGDDCRIRIAARFDACRAEGDEIVARAADGGEAWRLPMLRQAGDEGRSLADFVAPQAYGFDSPAGMFAISVHRDAAPADQRSETAGPQYRPGDHPAGCNCAACAMDYDSLLDRSLRLTLAEAASGWLDAELGKQLPQGSSARIVKPAAGYASCPDHSLKRDILALLPDGAGLDIRLTESCAMIPDASICGLVFAHPSASYPEIRRLTPAALDAYAARRGFSPDERRQFLGHLQ
jgi:5-methyltetrahydrofolate--homocysteine methyltransferase